MCQAPRKPAISPSHTVATFPSPIPNPFLLSYLHHPAPIPPLSFMFPSVKTTVEFSPISDIFLCHLSFGSSAQANLRYSGDFTLSSEAESYFPFLYQPVAVPTIFVITAVAPSSSSLIRPLTAVGSRRINPHLYHLWHWEQARRPQKRKRVA